MFLLCGHVLILHCLLLVVETGCELSKVHDLGSQRALGACLIKFCVDQV